MHPYIPHAEDGEPGKGENERMSSVLWICQAPTVSNSATISSELRLVLIMAKSRLGLRDPPASPHLTERQPQLLGLKEGNKKVGARPWDAESSSPGRGQTTSSFVGPIWGSEPTAARSKSAAERAALKCCWKGGYRSEIPSCASS